LGEAWGDLPEGRLGPMYESTIRESSEEPIQNEPNATGQWQFAFKAREMRSLNLETMR
jgi:hypothetical protein